jgi:hypothetical protein
MSEFRRSSRPGGRVPVHYLDHVALIMYKLNMWQAHSKVNFIRSSKIRSSPGGINFRLFRHNVERFAGPDLICCPRNWSEGSIETHKFVCGGAEAEAEDKVFCSQLVSSFSV